MANISSQLLFLTTSPRTPEKMVAEIDLLIKKFDGKKSQAEMTNDKTEIIPANRILLFFITKFPLSIVSIIFYMYYPR